jgi:hypothetical protein
MEGHRPDRGRKRSRGARNDQFASKDREIEARYASGRSVVRCSAPATLPFDYPLDLPDTHKWHVRRTYMNVHPLFERLSEVLGMSVDLLHRMWPWQHRLTPWRSP